MKIKNWLKYFGLSFFSDKQARTAARYGFATVFVSLLLAFVFFLIGFYAADIVPFSKHLNNSEKYLEFLEGAFSEDGISLEIKDKTAVTQVKANTFESQADREKYGKNGYDLIIDTRPSATYVQFTQTAVNGDKEISYESYLALSSSEKENYKIMTVFTDKEVEFTAELAESNAAYLDKISSEGTDSYNAEAAEDYRKLKESKRNMTEDQYRVELYYLYVRHYFVSARSILDGAKAPVLRDYYYINFITNGNAYYFYVFADMCAGSFKTDDGVPVVFGGYYNKCADGKITDIAGFINEVYYDTAGYTFGSYLMSTVSQIAMLVFIPLVLSALLWLTGRAVRNGWTKTFAGCYKTVNSFVWFSAFVTALITFACGFFVAARSIYAFMPFIFAGILLIRIAVFCITTVLANSKAAAESVDKSVFDGIGNGENGV